MASLILTQAEIELRAALVDRLIDMKAGDRLGTVADLTAGGDPEPVVHVLWTLVEEDLVVRVPGGVFYASPKNPLDRFPGMRSLISPRKVPPP